MTEKHPQKLIRHLQEVRKYSVQKSEAGIYQVHGDLIPIQIIVTKELSEKKNLWLKSLTDKLSEAESARNLVADYLNHPENNLYRSVIETIIRANRKTFEEVNGMGDIFMEIVQEKFDRKLKEALEKALEEERKKLEEKITETITRDVTERVTKDVSESVTKDVTESVTKDVTESVTKDVTERVTKDVSKKTRLTDYLSLIQKKYKKKKSLSVIADELETEPERLLFLYNIISENPDKTVDELYELASVQTN